MTMGICSVLSCIPISAIARWVLCSDSMWRPSITSTGLFSFSFCNGVSCCRGRSWSINQIPVAPQSINACVCITWSRMINNQVITKCFRSINPSNTSTFIIENQEIAKHCKAFEQKLFLSSKGSPSLNWLGLFSSPSPPLPPCLELLPLPLWRSGPFFLPHNSPPCG